MGGFTQPRHLAFLNPMDKTRKPKDSYEIRVSENRVRPSLEAYEPHVVYLAFTRYPVRWGHGRATRREVFSGFCKESEMMDRFKMLNGGWRRSGGHIFRDSDTVEYLDLCVWPGSPEERSLLNKYRRQAAKIIEKEQGEQEDSLEEEGIEGQEGIEGDEAESSLSSRETVPSIETEAVAVSEMALGADGLPLPTPPSSPPKKKKKNNIKYNILPPVHNFIRPLPPYTSPPIIIPFLTITLPTRPLASTLARLCNAFERGLPFYASVPNPDRKDGPAFFRRLLRLRMDRIRQLTGLMVTRLQGEGGGFFGLRLNAEDKGRGVEGEYLYEDLPVPVKGWAQIRWLKDDSEGWEGLEKETLKGSWELEEGIVDGGEWDEFAQTEGLVQGESKRYKNVATDEEAKQLELDMILQPLEGEVEALKGHEVVSEGEMEMQREEGEKEQEQEQSRV